MSPESEYHFDFRPDTSSESSNPADPKNFIDESDDPHYLDVYVQYLIAEDTGDESIPRDRIHSLRSME